MFENFNFKILEDVNFKEDSVREEIIVPILKELGYSATGKNRIVRSKSLKHPFIYVGTTKKEVTIIPDYLLCPDSKPYWILDAKSPKEDILTNKYIEQAYSYAIHPEIRAKYFALCNGKEFVLFSVLKLKPIIKFNVKDINDYLIVLIRLLHPEILAKEELIEFHPDLGIYYSILGFKPETLLINFIIPDTIAKLNDNEYSLTAGLKLEDVSFCGSFDFKKEQYAQLLALLPTQLSEEIKSTISKQPFHIILTEHIKKNKVPEITVASKLSKLLQHNNEEDFLPLKVEYFEKFG